LKKPAQAMEFIRALAGIRAKYNLPFACTMPTGFPWHNTYRKPATEQIHLPLDGVRVRKKIAFAVGDLEKIDPRKSKSAAAPNWTHGMDAALLIRVANAAVKDEITSIAAVHDAFACLAPQALQLRRMIGVQLSLLYVTCNVLGTLHQAAKQDLSPAALAKIPKGVETGKLDLMGVQNCEYSFM
jgi:DNA-directed RNA polymerase